MVPQVFLFGYYGFGNLGDEMLADYYIGLLQDHFSTLPLFVLVNNKNFETLNKRSGYIKLNRWNFWQLYTMMAPGDLLIGGGGSIFQDATSKRSLLYYLALLKIAQRCGSRIILAGQGFGPLSSWGRKVTGPGLNRAHAIACRDRESLATLAAMGVTKPILYSGVDPLWDYQAADNCSRTVPDQPLCPALGFIFRQVDSRKNDHEKLVFLSALHSRFGDLRLITFSPADHSAAHTMAKTIGVPPPLLVRDLATFEKFGRELSIVLSERLHGLVLAAKCGLPGIGFGTDPKIIAFCQQMGWESYVWHDSSLVTSVFSAIEGILADSGAARQRVRQQAAGWQEKGEEDRQWLLEQIEKALSRG